MLLGTTDILITRAVTKEGPSSVVCCNAVRRTDISTDRSGSVHKDHSERSVQMEKGNAGRTVEYRAHVSVDGCVDGTMSGKKWFVRWVKYV